MRITRRQFLAGATVAGAAVAARDVWPSRGNTHRAGGVLVLVAMYGGNDGLNTVIPYQDAAYLGGRPTLGFKPDDVVPLDASLALNPGLKGFKSLWDARQLAIVRGVGYPNPSYSHFRSMDIWQSGVPESDEQTGWLGRWLDRTSDPLLAVSFGPTMPKLLQGADRAGAAIPSGTLTEAARSYLLRLGGSGLAGRVAQSGQELVTVLHDVSAVLANQPPVIAAPAGGTPASAGGTLATQLDLVARLIKGGLPTRVYVVTAGGFDTHTNEQATQQRLLTELDAAVTPFVQAMAGRHVVVTTFSEFGRRVAENASGGTDHGSAAPVFVAGPFVKGGYYGEEPSLTDLDDGNLRFTTDFRSVYATVAAGVLGIDPTSLLRGSFAPLGFV